MMSIVQQQGNGNGEGRENDTLSTDSRTPSCGMCRFDCVQFPPFPSLAAGRLAFACARAMRYALQLRSS